MRNWSSNMKRFSLSYRTHFIIFIFIFMEYPSKEVTFVFSIDINTIEYYSKFKKYIDLY